VRGGAHRAGAPSPTERRTTGSETRRCSEIDSSLSLWRQRLRHGWWCESYEQSSTKNEQRREKEGPRREGGTHTAASMRSEDGASEWKEVGGRRGHGGAGGSCLRQALITSGRSHRCQRQACVKSDGVVDRVDRQAAERGWCGVKQRGRRLLLCVCCFRRGGACRMLTRHGRRPALPV